MVFLVSDYCKMVWLSTKLKGMATVSSVLYQISSIVHLSITSLSDRKLLISLEVTRRRTRDMFPWHMMNT
nr:hypothetical protein Iba_chr04eCG15670 [Ipomoea batatas]